MVKAMSMDKVSKERIQNLHPSVRLEVTLIVDEINSRLLGRSQVRIAQGLRTDKEQDELYKQLPKVTNAKGGESIHNYGFAVDIVLIIDKKTASWDTHKDWDNDKIADWDECVAVFAKYGWSWGGNWSSFKDMPHFDKIGKNNWRVLQKLPKDSNGYVII
jgi:peptidoglycan L-alanyl-D-glutamate endopeptidase CwlK